MMKKYVSYLCILFVLVVAPSVFAEDTEPEVAGDTYYTSGTAEASAGCWFEAHARDGSDGGQLTIELDGCQVLSYEVFYRAQNAGAGYIADLEPDDLIIVWDEDANHGEMEQYKNFSFTGDYEPDPDCDYIQLTTTDSRTNWAIYRVTESGSLYKGAQSGVGNEHEAIRLELQRNLLDFTKTYYVNGDPNDVGCAGPGDEITFEICWNNTSGTTFEDPNIIDYLPPEVDYDYLISIMPYITDPNYNQEDRTYTWQIDTIFPSDSGCVELTVEVNNKAEPGMEIHNVAEMWTYDPSTLIARATEDTPVCCWEVDDPNVIYVDIAAAGYDTGVDWTNAYSGEDGLQKALKRASESTCDVGLYTIYVAAGVYNPGDLTSDTFVIPEGAKVYGGFMSGGSSISERNPDTYETVLTGHRFIDTDPNEVFHYHIYNDTIVTMEDLYVSDPNFPVNETSLLDGFTISEATIDGIYGTDVGFNIVNCTVADSGDYGIYAENADLTIENCTVTDSVSRDGIYVENGDVVIKWCNVRDGGRYGIYHEGEGNVISVENSKIIRNKQYGIFSVSSTPTIKNCIVFGNGFFESGFDGVRMTLPTEVPVLYNNTIIYNAAEGIDWFDDRTISDPNDKDWPDIQNCILWYNNDEGTQVAGFDQDTYASYCGIQNCTEVNNNINDTPGFVLTYEAGEAINPYHYHLAYDSVDFKDAGNPSHTTTELGLYDIDGEDRLDNSRADIGADELYSCDGDLTEDDIYNSLDWNFDGIVNNYEFAEFSDMWLIRDPNDPGIITDPNFVGNPDYADPATLAMWFEKWDTFYNLDNIGSSEYMIDIDDLMVIADDWVWIACWKQSQFDHFDSMVTAMAMGGGESMMMAPMAMSSMSMAFEPMPEPEPAPEPDERSTAETVSFVEGIYGMIEYIDTSIEEDHENAENLYEVSDFLKDVLLDLQAEREDIK